MCDVDAEAVVAAVDAPSIYDIPKVLHDEGLDAYVVRRLGLPFRDVDWTDLGRAAAPGPRARRTRSRSRSSASTSTCPTPTCRSPRRCAPAGSPTTRGSTIRWVASRRLRDRRRAPQQRSATSTASCVPGGFGVRGIEGKIGALQLRPRARHPDARPVPRPAVHGHRVRPRRGRPRGRELRRVRRGDAAPGHRHDGRPARRRRRRARHGRHDAPGRSTRPSWPRARSSRELYGEPYVDERHRHRYEVNNAYRERSRRPAWCSPAPRPTAASSSSSSCPREVHPYFVATQAHPELRSRPTRAHPLFRGLIGAAMARRSEKLA